MTFAGGYVMEPGESNGSGQGLSLVVCLGGLSGLILGVVVVMLAAAGLYYWMPGSRVAEVFWEIAAPLLGILGVVVGSALAHRLLRDRLWLTLSFFLFVLTVGLILAFWLVGFPFRVA